MLMNKVIEYFGKYDAEKVAIHSNKIYSNKKVNAICYRYFYNCTFEEIDFSHSKMSRFVFENCTFNRCTFEAADMNADRYIDDMSYFIECIFIESDISCFNWDVYYNRCTFIRTYRGNHKGVIYNECTAREEYKAKRLKGEFTRINTAKDNLSEQLKLTVDNLDNIMEDLRKELVSYNNRNQFNKALEVLEKIEKLQKAKDIIIPKEMKPLELIEF